MIGQKHIKKECCKKKENILHRSKNASCREVVCKKCGYIIMTNETGIHK